MAQSIRSNGNLSTAYSIRSSDIRSSSLIAPVHVAEYLARRLFEVGVRAVHGVPGDHNLLALDYLDHCGLSWAGNCNELNAGYAADGYARIKGISALVTSYGVGELSALNAIAGSYAEFVPVVHIVGTPPTYSQRNGLQLHNPLSNGNNNTFADMSRSISCASVTLTDPAYIPDQIDHAIRECWVQSKPVYIALPADVVQQSVEGDRLRAPIDLSYPANDPDKEDYVVDVVLRYMHAARNAVILVDACAIRHRALLEVHDLVERSRLPTFVSPMGKGAVNEALPNYCGVYAGDGSDDEVRERVETADLVLSIGAMKNDFATPGFSYRVSELSTIDFHSNLVRVKYSEYPDLRMNGVLRKIVDRLPQLHIVPGPTPSNNIPAHRRDTREELTHAWFWRHMARWLQPSDIVITETGTPNFGIWEARFPPNVTAINQVLWNSAGYATAACQGAALAAQELVQHRPNRRLRTILFTGDGSFQLTAQEISTMIRRKLTPIIFILCNDASTSERVLHRPDGSYNIDAQQGPQRWRYKDLIPALGAEKGTYQSAAVSTRKQVQALFADETFNEARCLQFVELRMAKDDAPVGMRAGTVPLQLAPSRKGSPTSSVSQSQNRLTKHGSASTYGTRSTEATSH